MSITLKEQIIVILDKTNGYKKIYIAKYIIVHYWGKKQLEDIP